MAILAFWSVRGGDGNEVCQRRSDGSVPAEPVPALDLAPAAGQVIYSEDGEWMVIESGDDIFAVPLDPLGAPAGHGKSTRSPPPSGAFP